MHCSLSYLVSHAYMLQDGTPFIYIFPARPYIQMYRPVSRTGNTQGRKSVPVPWLDNKFLTLLCSCLLENMNIIRRNYVPFMTSKVQYDTTFARWFYRYKENFTPSHQQTEICNFCNLVPYITQITRKSCTSIPSSRK